MNLTGEYIFNGNRGQVWKALNNPEVLRKCTPGCQSMQVVEEDIFEMVLKIGIAAISGTYKAKMQLCNKVEPETYAMLVSGSGPIGTMNIVGDIALEDNAGSTKINYTFEVTIGGVMTGLGMRALSPIAKVLMKQFFNAINEEVSKVA
jgi:carbon monoxide dehydrogenase subunit G